jgi:hypothetical protein
MNRRSHSSVKSHAAPNLSTLTDLDRNALIVRWQKLYGTLPPVKTSQQLLFQAVVYRLQEQAAGGLKPATRRFLEQVAKGNESGQKASALIFTKPGTRLLREWHGITYEAIVLDDGVLFQSKKYRSLSEVARAITGVRWSGPLFFGLKKKSAEKGGAA